MVNAKLLKCQTRNWNLEIFSFLFLSVSFTCGKQGNNGGIERASSIILLTKTTSVVLTYVFLPFPDCFFFSLYK